MANANFSDDDDDFEKLSLNSFSTVSSLIDRKQAVDEKDECLAIHISNLPAEVNEDEIYKTFRPFGLIASPGIRIHGDNPTVSYAFVHFNSASVVERILKSDTPIIIRGSKLTIKAGNSKKIKTEAVSMQKQLPKHSENGNRPLNNLENTEVAKAKEETTVKQTSCCSIWVGNVPFGATPNELAKKFTAFGKLNKIAANIYPRENGECCYGFVNFVSPDSVKKIIDIKPKIYLNECLLEIRVSNSKRDVGIVVDGPCSSNIDARKKDKSKLNDVNKNVKFSSEESKTLWVGNLPPNASSKELYTIFAPFGKLDKPGIFVYPSPKSPTCFAFVNYISKDSVEEVLTYKSPIHFKGNRLLIRLQTAKRRPGSGSDTSSVCSNPKPLEPVTTEAQQPSFFMLRVKNLPKDIPRVEVFNIFRDFGNIAEPPSLQINERDREAYVPFVHKADVEKLFKRFNGLLHIRNGTVTLVLARAYNLSSNPSNAKKNIPLALKSDAKTKHPFVALPCKIGTLNQNNLRATDKINPPIDAKMNATRQWTEATSLSTPLNDDCFNGVQIRNINKLSSSDILHQYVKNERRSQGGNVKKFYFEKEYDRAVVIFERADVAESFLKKLDHRLENHDLYVSRLPPNCENRFYLGNIPQWVTLDRLKDYLEARAHCEVDQVLFKEDNKGALITFKDKIPSSLENELSAKPLKDGDKQMSDAKYFSVVNPDAVLVYGKIPSEDSLTLAFEDVLSTDNEIIFSGVRKVFSKAEIGMTLVIFEDYQAVSCLSASITIGKDKFSLSPFHDYLGWVSEKNAANFVREHSSATVEKCLMPLQLEFLTKQVGYDFIKNEIKNQNWNCHFEINNDKQILMLTASTKELSGLYVDFVLSCMKVFEIALDGPMLKSWNEKGSHLRQIVSDKDIQNWFCFSDSKTKLSVLAASTQIKRIQQMVENFFSDNSVYDETIVDCQIFGKYLKKYQETDLKLKCSSLKFVPNGQLRASGTKNQIEILKFDVKLMLSDLEIAEYAVRKPGMSNYFRTDSGFTKINAIAEKTETIILNDTEFDPTFNGTVASINDSVIDGFLNRKLKISVIWGDMTRQSVDAIVNAANEDLEHSGGLAGAILEAGGPQIQIECRNHVKLKNRLNVSEVYVSQAGKLPCKKIIHVVGPRWSGENSGEPTKLRNAIMHCINAADAENLSSIAVPAVSTKIFGFPVEKAVPIIVDAIVDASENSKIVREVRIVDTDKNTVALFARKVLSLKGFQRNKDLSLLPGIASKVAPLLPLSICPINDIPQNIVNDIPQNIKQTCLIVNGCTIKVLKNNIVNVAKQCNVIVNTTSASNLLGGSTSCNAIMNAAGSAYTDDIKQKYPNGLQNAVVGRTLAGQLGCQYVYHIACPAWDATNGEMILTDKVSACLTQLMNDGCTSIAFPAIGTGGLRYPASTVAKTMFDATIKWLNSNKAKLVSVNFVVFPTDVVTSQHFENEYVSRTNGSGIAASVHTAMAPGSSAVKIGAITIEVIHGNITKEKTDCIVCPSNAKLDLSKGQVAKALKEAGGKAFEKILLAYEKSPFKKGVLPVNTTNVLPHEYVLFIDTSTKNNEDWQDLFEQTLKEANLLNMGSLAVPALGTGTLNRNIAEVADMMMRTIQTFASNRNRRNTNLKKIRIVIFQSSMYEQFCQHISTLIARSETRSVSNSLYDRALDIILKRQDSDVTKKSVPVEASEVEQNLVLFICGSKLNVEKAQDLLDITCNDHCPERTLTKDIIGDLDRDTIDRLHSQAEKYNVNMFVSQEQKKIKIKGFRAIEFQNFLSDVLDKMKDEISDVIAKWYKRKDASSSWELIKFGVARLEKAFKNWTGRGCVPIDLEENESVSIDFDKMIGSVNQKIVFYLKRIDSEHIPVEWEWDGKCSDTYKLIPLDPRLTEYATVSKAVRLTASVNILKIERVENPVKYKQYMVLKQKMEQSVAKNVIEMSLFHGTAAQNVAGICTDGFNRSLCGQNGTMYGSGSYFARDFKYSAGYGQGTVFYSKVLTGNFIQGNSSIKVAPDLDVSKGTKFDSVVDNMTAPSIYVVFSDNHAYPAYLITYA